MDQPNPRKQLLVHLEGLRNAGVDHLPNLERLPVDQPEESPHDPVGETIAEPEITQLSEPEPEMDPIEQRRHHLDVLASEVAACHACPDLQLRTQTVFGTGTIDPVIGFVGEAPGEQEDRTGEPFVGPAGQLLTRIIGACGLTREEVYICNIIKCRPPGNRNPNASECRNCRNFLERQLDLVHPPYLVALGRVAAHNLLNTTEALGRMRGRFHEYRGIPVVVTYHPSALLRAPEPKRTEMKREVWEDMKMLLRRMGRPIPTAGARRSNQASES